MTQPHQPYPHQPYGGPPPIPPKAKRWPLIVGLAGGIPIMLIILTAFIGAAVGSGGADTAASPPPPAPAVVASSAPAPVPAAPAAPAATIPPAGSGGGLFQHPEDVAVASCTRSPATGWPAASLKIVNGSGKASTYYIRVSFQSQDGATQYGEGFATVSSLAPGQSTIQTAQGLNDVPAGASLACVVTSVQRTEAL